MTGVDIILYNKIQVGIDEFNRPIYAETPETVENVLIGEPTAEDIINEMNISGKRLAYTLGIPKGDVHVWEDRTVEFFGEKFHTFGRPTQGMEHLIPLDWNKKVKVETYE